MTTSWLYLRGLPTATSLRRLRLAIRARGPAPEQECPVPGPRRRGVRAGRRREAAPASSPGEYANSRGVAAADDESSGRPTRRSVGARPRARRDPAPADRRRVLRGRAREPRRPGLAVRVAGSPTNTRSSRPSQRDRARLPESSEHGSCASGSTRGRPRRRPRMVAEAAANPAAQLAARPRDGFFHPPAQAAAPARFVAGSYASRRRRGR